MTLPDSIAQRGCHCGSITAIHLRWCPVQIAADLRNGALGEDEEPEAPMVYGVRGGEKELWSVVAYRAGHWVQLSPKHFPFCGNYDEVVDRAQIKLSDVKFRARWRGYYLAGCRVDRQVMA